MQAYQNMDTEKLVELLNTAPKSYVPDYYKKSIAEAMQHDEKRALEWTEVKDMMTGVQHAGHDAPRRMLSNYAQLERPTFEKRTGSHSVRSGMMNIEKKSALAQGDNLHVAQPKLNIDAKRRADEALEALAPNVDSSDNDSGGTGGYGF
jgi:hypothetical protein